MSAILSPCSLYRYRLERTLRRGTLLEAEPGIYEGQVFAFVGVNPSTADASINDQTVEKWIGFVTRWGGSRFIVGNVFAYRETDVDRLAAVTDPVGPENIEHLRAIVSAADIVVPCWGSRAKLPKRLHWFLDATKVLLCESGKPLRTLGLTASGDPKHPLMLGYKTPLTPWVH